MATGSMAEVNEDGVAPTSASVVTELAVEGMTCGNCVRHVVEAIQSVPGVQSASASVETNRAAVRWAAEGGQDVQAVVRAVQEAGYDAKLLVKGGETSGRHTFGGWQLNLWIGLLGTLPLMIGEWVFQLGTVGWFRWCSFFIASMVQVVGGAPFYRGAWKQLKAGSSNMDTLVALGSTAAFGYSTYVLFSGAGGHTYFMEAAAIISLISIGHWMEARVSARASSALKALLSLAPEQARRLSSDGSETLVPLSQLRISDRVILRPGDRVPTDGEVTDGESAVDESMLTGESTPVDKAAGTLVYAGTLNINGRLTVRVTAMGEATALSRIIVAVERAQTSRADIQRLGDRVSSVFVPIVVAVAVLAGVGWAAFPEQARQIHGWLGQYLWHAHLPSERLALPIIIGVSVLVIACPCAMGLATPAAIMAGSNAAAQRGILIRDGVALEKAGNITAVLFDKTGTLTAGKPEVRAVWVPAGGVGKDEVQALAVALATHSGHPISQAISRLVRTSFELVTWEEIAGSGVAGKIQGEVLKAKPAALGKNGSASSVGLARLGSLNWLRASQVDLSGAREFIERSMAEGATVVGLAIDAELAGVFAVTDALKPGARQVVEDLQAQGFRTFLVTGDNARTASSIALQVGMKPEEVMSEIRPEQKAELVKKLQQGGQRVAFVGDGINDAPALEQADLGIAVSRASDIAREAADIILLNSEIEAVPESLGLARATLRTIKQNLFWAFFYNALGIPLAALGFMSPILCAAAMGFSDMVVIGNALRLRWWRLGSSR